MSAMRSVSVILVLLLSIGCGTSMTSPTSTAPSSLTDTPSSCAPGTAKGSMTVQIDGTTWNATCVGVVKFDGTLVINGHDSANPALAITLTSMDAASNVVTFGASQTPFGIALVSTSAGDAWMADSAKGSGSFIVTRTTPFSASGTFSFTAVATQGAAAGTKTLTNGTFDVRY
jgi:hypothetical protein